MSFLQDVASSIYRKCSDIFIYVFQTCIRVKILEKIQNEWNTQIV